MTDKPTSATPDFRSGVPLAGVPDGGTVLGRVDTEDAILVRHGDQLFAVGRAHDGHDAAIQHVLKLTFLAHNGQVSERRATPGYYGWLTWNRKGTGLECGGPTPLWLCVDASFEPEIQASKAVSGHRTPNLKVRRSAHFFSMSDCDLTTVFSFGKV